MTKSTATKDNKKRAASKQQKKVSRKKSDSVAVPSPRAPAAAAAAATEWVDVEWEKSDDEKILQGRHEGKQFREIAKELETKAKAVRKRHSELTAAKKKADKAALKQLAKANIYVVSRK